MSLCKLQLYSRSWRSEKGTVRTVSPSALVSCPPVSSFPSIFMLPYASQEPHAPNALVQGIALHGGIHHALWVFGNLCARRDDFAGKFRQVYFFWTNSFSCERDCTWQPLDFISDLLLCSCSCCTLTGFSFARSCMFELILYSQLNSFQLSYPRWLSHSTGPVWCHMVLGIMSRHFVVKENIYSQNTPFTSPLMPSRWDPTPAFCNLFIYVFIWPDGGCSWDKGSWRRLIFKRTSVICCRRQSALSFAPVKEGSQRFKGQHCLCSAMLNHF